MNVIYCLRDASSDDFAIGLYTTLENALVEAKKCILEAMEVGYEKDEILEEKWFYIRKIKLNEKHTSCVDITDLGIKIEITKEMLNSVEKI